MSAYASKLSAGTEAFAANRQDMLGLVEHTVEDDAHGLPLARFVDGSGFDHVDNPSDAFHASGPRLDRGAIDPRDTRKVPGLALDTLW
ncbi:MAG: hypothetical protein MI723_18610, partial [Caulobacterales bacterium]|nr:hypothetical protein [Caulobacterales bacterium]